MQLSELTEQVKYIRRSALDMIAESLTLDGPNRAKLMAESETRYHSSDMEANARRFMGELDELGKMIEKAEQQMSEAAKEDELTNLDKI